MKYKSLAFIILTTTLLSCKNKYDKSPNYSLKDSVLAKHFRHIDSSTDFDTTDINYKVLKAYIANDTSYFKELDSDIDEYKKNEKVYQSIDSCIHQSKLQSLAVDEAYRFVYWKSFCQYNINVTISNKGDSSNLHLILYQHNWGNGDCIITNEYDKKITPKEWNDIMLAMDKADYWALKKDNGVHGLDGDGLTVSGFKKGSFNRPNQLHFVHRWAVDRTSLDEPFRLILKLSGIKQNCLWPE